MATMPSQIKRLFEFGPFRLDPQKRLLLRGNEAVPLTPKAIETLIVLVENRSRVVSKDELMKVLWPDSFVEEANLSQNIFMLRKALGDSHERRYILTIPGRGYQFTEVVREVGGLHAEEALVMESHTRSLVSVGHAVSGSKRNWSAAILLLLLLMGGGVVGWITHGPERVHRLTQLRLTANPPDLPVLRAVISPDGKYLGYSDQQGIHLQLIETREAINIPPPSGTPSQDVFWDFESWYPDGTHFLAYLAIPGKPDSLWSVPILGGPPRRLIDDVYDGLGVSPDGSAIVFSRLPAAMGPHEIWLMGPEGESPHRILATVAHFVFGPVAWAPGGDRIAYVLLNEQGENVGLESCDRNGEHKTRLLADVSLRDFAWLAPDRLLYSHHAEGGNDYYSDNLWEIRADPKTGVAQGEPHQLTDWSGFWVSGLSTTADAKHLEFLRGTNHETVFVGELTQTKGLINARRLTMDDNSNLPLAWMPDSQQVIFSSLRTGTRQLYRQALDGRMPPQLITTDPTLDLYVARLTPDGSGLIVEGGPHSSRKLGLYRVAATGGVPQLQFEISSFVDFRCTDQHVNLCVYGELVPDQKELVITSFNPLDGQRKELRRINVDSGEEYHWCISPDGS